MLALRQTAEIIATVQATLVLAAAGMLGLLYLGLLDRLYGDRGAHAAGPGRPSTSETLWLTLAAQGATYRPPARPREWSPSAAYGRLRSARQRAAERSMARRTAALRARPVGYTWSARGDDEWL